VWTAFQPSPGRFVYPLGITVDGQGNVYVLTGFGDNELYKLSPSGRPLMLVGPSVFLTGPDTHNFYGSGAPLLWYVLASAAVDARGNIYVVDAANFRILKLSATGHLLATWGDVGGTPGHFGFPSGIAVDRRGYVYVADQGTDRVEKFSSDGKWVTRWGSWGAGQGQFRNPRDVAVDAQGKVYVVDAGDPAEKGSYRVQKFSAEGDFISTWGRRASGLNRFPRHPQGSGADAQWLATVAHGIATDAHGDIYVADTGNNRILELSPTGKPLAHWGTRGTRPGQFNGPTRVAVDGQGNIYVADTGNNRIQKLTRGT
jgi:DNA-binding beta-propeller fold protein YncE